MTQLHAITNSPKVVIIGGGLAGLTTSLRLQEMNYDVELYEARNRLGGRVFTAMLEGHPVELGGYSLLDGGESTNIFSLIKQFGIELHSFRKKLSMQFISKNQISDPLLLLKEYGFTPSQLQNKLKKIRQSAKNMDEVLKQLFPEDDFLYQFFRVRLNSYEGAAPEFLSTFYLPTLYHSLLGGVSLAHPASEENYMHFVTVKERNSLLIEKLAGKLAGKIFLNSPLTAIQKIGDQYKLTFKTGKEVLADIVVLACPCTVYDDIKIESNVIPTSTLQSIKNVRYGMNSKIFFPVKEFVQTQNSYSNNRMIAAQNQWNSVTFYLINEYSKFTSTSIQEAYQKDFSLMQELFQLTQPSVLPTIASDESFANYHGPVGHSWTNDPYAKGSYSCIATGQEELLTEIHTIKNEKVKKLFSPLNNNTLFFAGEHTSILLDFGGTMEAAVESGERTARLIHQTNEWF